MMCQPLLKGLWGGSCPDARSLSSGSFAGSERTREHVDEELNLVPPRTRREVLRVLALFPAPHAKQQKTVCVSELWRNYVSTMHK